VKKAAEILDLTPYLDRYPRQLSGGQRQRVAMGRAIVRDPKVFLFDEPLSNLDSKLRMQMRAEIKKLHQRLKTTTIYVTHDQVEAMSMAERIVVMQAGRIEQVGAPLELFDCPANVFVAGFIGSPTMNLLKGEAAGDGVEIGGVKMPIPEGVKLSARQVVLYGVRPEHFELSADGLEAQVKMVELTGSETMVFLRFGEREIVALFRDRHDFKQGDTLVLRPRAERVHLFDPNTGRRL
jgi:multiple sugar transport system ATP-binding protein